MLQNDLIDMINLRRAFDGSRNSSFFSTLIIENSAKDPFNSTFAWQIIESFLLVNMYSIVKSNCNYSIFVKPPDRPVGFVFTFPEQHYK